MLPDNRDVDIVLLMLRYCQNIKGTALLLFKSGSCCLYISVIVQIKQTRYIVLLVSFRARLRTEPG